jgi:predicted DNA-binding protein with PD1-like motif
VTAIPRSAILVLSAGLLGAAGVSSVAVAGRLRTAAPAKVYAGAHIDEIYRVSLVRGDLVLESINQAIRQHGIQDGAVLTMAGATSECTYHYMKDSEKDEDVIVHQKGAAEIIGASGIIANAEAHVHITLAGEKGAFGGHLRDGCKVLYVAEITLAKFTGPPLARAANKDGIVALGPK